jgi:DNA-binding NarL/FixJ family response regulator
MDAIGTAALPPGRATAMAQTKRILIADDHALFRAGMRTLLRMLPNVKVVAEAATGREAVDLARQHHPDVVVMDISMREMNGLDAALRIKAENPGIRIIILSMHESEEFVVRAFRSGASGYLLKDSTESELKLALDSIMRGETYLSPRVSRHVVNAFVERADPASCVDFQLTPRQREILQLLAEGHSTKEVAYRLGVSIKTVESHRAQIMKRLDIRDLPGLVRYAIRSGLVSPER